jgi:hypothetical protein
MKIKPNPMHQKETEFHGSYQAFTGTVISPNEPRAYKGARKGRPADTADPQAKKRRKQKPKK